MKILASMLLGLALAFTPGPALAQDQNTEKTVVFAVDPNWPPLEFLDSNQRIIGYAADFFTAVCREVGLKAEFVKVDWEQIFSGLEAGKFDAVMSSVTVTPERRRTMDFTIPYYIVRQSLLVPHNSSLNNIRQLAGQKTGTQVETTATEIVEKIPGAVSVTYPSIEDAIKALAAGELDAVICEDVVAANYLGQSDLAAKVKMASIIDTPGAEELYSVAVKKNNLKVLVPLNDGIKAVRTKGLEEELRRKWFKGAK
jgi:ABC-type amino acid transport/signal transduction systems, periplasmic component/domain